MTTCKNCKNPAVKGPWHKKYCRPCGELYLERRRQYAETWRTMPPCESKVSDLCTGKVPLDMHSMGLVNCQRCETHMTVEQQSDTKANQLRDAETVDDLRAWIETYLLSDE